MSRLETKILGVILFVFILGCIISIFVVVYLQKTALYEISSIRVSETAEIIARNLERSMVEGKAEVTRAMVNDYRTSKGIEEVNVYNHEGREAFTTGGSLQEQETVAALQRDKDTEVLEQDGALYIYKPLLNTPLCQSCHGTDKTLLGAIKIVVPLAKEDEKVASLFGISIGASVVVIIGLSTLMIVILRRLVIRPVEAIERAATMLSDGDLSFSVTIKSRDEIGRMSRAMRSSLVSISSVLRKVQDVSQRISKVAGIVEHESRKILEGTQLESEAIENISSAVEELNASITEISESTDSLAASVEETAASMEQMSVSITQITQSTLSLFTAVEETSSSIEEMSSTIKAVAESSDKLSGTSEDTFSAIEELNISIREVDRNAKESSALSHRVVEDATKNGLQSVEKTVEGMERIKQAVEKAAELIRRLGDRSEEIGKILTVIDEITEQTTLLSLNAAILASQAGEYGKGFSVVADEIKDLAERTSFSTQEIATLINTVRQEVAESVVAMDEGVKTVEDGFALANNSDESLKKIVESAHKSSEMSVAIERATEQQAKAVKLVGESMEKVKQMIASIVRATTEQRKGASLIIATTEKVRDFTAQVKNASEEQATSSKQISKAMEIVSEKTHQISSALREQKVGASNIQVAVEKISQLPDQNRERAMVLNRSLKDLSRDSELVMTEMRRFRFQEASSLDVITFGIVPLESPSEMHRKFSPLARYLGEKTGKHVDIKVAGNFAEAVSDISKGVAQVSFMSPSTYIQAHAEADVRVIAIAVRSGKSYYHSVVVASPKKSIERIEDLRGKTFAFGDVNSTSSHIVPRYMLKEAGITLNDLQYYNHLAMHDDVAEAVLAGDFDGGGVMEKTALKYKERGLRLIKYSAEIPDFNICVSKNLGQHEENRILQALLDLGEGNPESASILNAIDRTYTGFARANDADYDGIRDIMKKLGML